jgi:toxin-antitoxin system PIN domain toxin
VIAVDTNLLIYAHRFEVEWNEDAYRLLAELSEGSQAWAIPYPCIHEFVRVVTDPRIYADPTPLDRAFEQLRAWDAAPTLRLIGEGGRHVALLEQLALAGRVRGPMIHDARIAAICLDHGVRELWTADRDFGRFKALRTRNPLVG